ncbi:hypothetical protein G9A89_000157, partial [Geosiphon pyriformis]
FAQKLVQQNQFTSQNQFYNNNNKIDSNNQLVLRNSGQQRLNYYHTQLSYFTMSEKSDFQQTAFSKDEVAVPRSNPLNNTIPLAQIAQNTNLLDIFLFGFEANKSPFLLSNIAVNEQKAITAMYTKAKVEKKQIRLILNIIVTTDGMKKTPVRKIDNFLFTINEITNPVKVLVMDALQY